MWGGGLGFRGSGIKVGGVGFRVLCDLESKAYPQDFETQKLNAQIWRTSVAHDYKRRGRTV